MNFLKFAILLWCIGFLAPAMGSDVTFDFERLKTTHGRVYHDIMVLDSDRHGLLFRHARGIAKLNFSELSMNLRMLYEPVGEDPIESPPEYNGKGDGGSSVLNGIPNLVITARSRTEVPLNLPWYHQGPCAAYRQAWPVHWPRYHPALRLAIPDCRARAVDDFLITTGLAPRPWGVSTYRLPYNRPYLLY